VAVEFVRDTIRGQLPPTFALAMAIAIAVPPAATVAGALWLRSRPFDLLKLFYGVELPIFFLSLARIFLVRQLTPPVAVLSTFALLGLVAFMLDLRRHPLCRSRIAAIATLAGQTALICLSLYVGLLLLFYIVPLATLFLIEAAKLEWIPVVWRALTRSPQSFLLGGFGGLLFASSATLFFPLPIVAAVLYAQAVRRAFHHVTRKLGRWPARATAALSALAFFTALVVANQQPQQDAFAVLAEPPVTDANRLAILADEEDTRAGLVNAYLAAHRYLATDAESDLMKALYAEAFGCERDEWAGLQEAHDLLASPWLYAGESFYADAKEASALFEQYFDAPIQRGERQEILAALNATWKRDSIEAGLLNANAETVWLARQELSVEEHGAWAEVQLHEVYENQTFEQQEVLYYFALPESAVATGLWLSDSGDFEDAFRFVVAPRGAAQAVYRSEVQRRIDPALLEQVGPRQYRLRVFPVPAREEAPEKPLRRAHVWLRYRVLARNGAWPLPRLLERRNVFWTGDTERTLGGEPLAAPANGWMWPELRARRHTALPQQVDLSNGLRVRATPATVEEQTTMLPRGSYLAVLLDRSLSMREHAAAVASAVETLQEGAAGRATIDWYLTSAPTRGEPPAVVASLRPEEIIYFGGHSTTHMLSQLEQLRRGRRYDAVLVLTDAGGYELEPEMPPSLDVESPLWLVHLGGELPLAYADPLVAEMARTGGGVVFEVDDLLARLASRQSNGRSGRFVRDGWVWTIEPGRPQSSVQDPFAPLAARAASDQMASRLPAQPSAAHLNELHALAKEQEIVTPYSSMIVLVNDFQRQALHRAEEAEDRFAREVESGKESIPGARFAVSGVPEPHEWALIALVLTALAVYGRRFSGRPLVPGRSPGEGCQP
jgi:putative PEP-CTERM system integral membrane protein